MQFLRSNMTKFGLIICLFLSFINIFSLLPVSFIVYEIVQDTEFECT